MCVRENVCVCVNQLHSHPLWLFVCVFECVCVYACVFACACVIADVLLNFTPNMCFFFVCARLCAIVRVRVFLHKCLRVFVHKCLRVGVGG